MTVEFGFGLITCQRYPGDVRTDAELYAQALELAADAERLGFDSVWVSEHHFLDDAYMPSLMPVCAAIAARTDRIAIGTGLLLAPLYEPVRLAEDAATVDLISGGRLILGIGLGWRAEEFEALRIPIRERAPRLEDTVTVLRQAWSGQAVSGGGIVSYPDVPVTPRPGRRGGPPIWIGGLTEPAIRRAGRIADGFMASDVTPESFAQQVAWAEQERKLAGRADVPFSTSLHLPTFAWKGDPDEAWELVKAHHRYVGWKYDDMEEARGRMGPPPEPPALPAEGEAALRTGIVLGTPEEVAARIGRFADAAGGDVHYIARLYWPGMGWEVQREAMRVFAEEVIPRVNGGRRSSSSG